MKASVAPLVTYRALYPHLELEENRRELERERTLRREIRASRRDASARAQLLFRLRQAFRPSQEPELRSPRLGRPQQRGPWTPLS